MIIIEFSKLPFEKQIDFLYYQGVYVGKQRSALHVILMFQVEAFYVEVYYQKYRSLITGIHSFFSPEKLEPYLRR